jgi:hypothetical protein
MSKHTQAPWLISDDGEGRWNDSTLRSVRIANPEGSAIADTYVNCLVSTDEECRANARLIAAAPDLLRELSHLVRLLEPMEDDGGLDIPGLATLNGARAAIAKATGEAA